MKKSDAHAGANSIVRIIFIGLSVVAQAVWIIVQIVALSRYSAWISLISSLLAALVVLKLYSNHTNAALKMPWIMLILVFPVMGLSLYLLMEVCGDLGGTKKRLDQVRREMPPAQGREVPAGMEWSRSLVKDGNPVYTDTAVRYFAEAQDAFEALKADLEQAEKFIFMEYFIVEDGEAFRQIEEILARKAAAGVEVRLLYDDFGSIGVANLKFVRRLNGEGIRCRVFNPAVPLLNVFMNHRDHRKITVIDGRVGYTGGFNLAGEYFGFSAPFGHWKDTGLRLEGRAVEGLTRTFLELWRVTTRKTEDVSSWLDAGHAAAADGHVLPFGDDPLSRNRAAEDLFLNLIGSARERIWFITPYLIITDEMTRALGLAARRGVDVRVITPGIPDKKAVYGITRSYYAGLVRHGVRIFEYTPGFCHAKMCVRDAETAVVGTSNLDFRSLYLHFENDVILHQCAAVADVERDFREMFEQSAEVTDQYISGRGAMLMVWQCVLRLFSPLM